MQTDGARVIALLGTTFGLAALGAIAVIALRVVLVLWLT
jgi:hypothetical protein